MNIRFVLTKIDKDGARSLVDPVQGRYTYSTRKEAQKDLDALLTNNTQQRLEEVFGKQSIGTFKVSPVECYPGHNDPMRFYVED